MKIRKDYVSNSSSASFILSDSEMFKHFNIGKKELIETLYALLPEDNRNEFCVSVYDMHDENDRKAIKEIDGCLMGFTASMCYINPNTNKLYLNDRPAREWNEVLDAIANAYNAYGVIYDDIDCEMDVDIYDEDGNYVGCERKPLPNYVKTFIKKAKKQFGVIDNWTLCQRPEVRWVIHFGDNIQSNLKDFHMPGKWKDPYVPKHGIELDDYQLEYNEMLKKSIYESDDYSCDRFLEILVNYWESTGKIDKNDKWFENLKGNPHFTPLCDDVWSYCLHEG